jgi:hypothetical protein
MRRHPSDSVKPFVLADRDLAKASIRLYEVAGELSGFFRANVEAIRICHGRVVGAPP